MSGNHRRGACPTLAAPMATGDGLLARLNPVSGGIAPSTLGAIAEGAARFGNGQIEVTARGSLQIRGLTDTSAPRFAEAVDRLAVSVRSGVPVETGPLAGLDPEELADPTPLADGIRDGIGRAGLSGRLGPKVSVVVDGGGRLRMDTVLADVRLEAFRADDEVLWRVAIGGTSETARLLGVVETARACAVVIDLLQAVAAMGQIARARDLSTGDLAGTMGMLAADSEVPRPPLPPSVLPDISPPRGEIGGPRPIASFWNVENWRSPSGRPISPPGGGNVEHLPRMVAGGASPITTLPLADGRAALGIGLPFGQATAGQVIDLADAAIRHGADEIRFAPGRALFALCRMAAEADALKIAAAALGFVTDPSDPRLTVVACAGAPACASGHLPARGVAAEIAAEAAPRPGQIVHVSGCAKQCARPADAAFTLIGTAQGCEIHRGDGGEGTPVARVANDAAAAAFGRAASLYRNDKKTGKEAASDAEGPGKARVTNHREA